MSHAPEAEFAVTAELVTALLRAQHPDLAELPVVHAAHGWDNDVFRLGDALAVRMPRRALARDLIASELEWLPLLAPTLPVAIPAAVRGGVPALGYPWPWAVVPWFDGVSAATVEPVLRDAYAEPLAAFFAALHRPAPANAPVNPFRGGGVESRTDAVAERRALLAGARTDLGPLDALWHSGLAASPHPGHPVWLHGDPHPHNVVVDAETGRLRAVVDFGDITSGDPASDLGMAWLHFTASGRARFFDAVGLDTHTHRRARAWAVHYTLMMLLLPATSPLRGVGEHALGQLGDERA